MLQKLRNDEKGFTLIELMIVVGIIAILAAIAVPQFRTYRIRANNTKSVTTVKKTIIALSALNSDIGCYGLTAAEENLQGVEGNTEAGTGAVLNGVSAATATVAGGHVTGTNADGVISGVGLSVPSNVDLRVDVTAGNISYHIFSEAVGGNRAFGVDSDFEDNVYFVQNDRWATLAAGLNNTAPTARTDNVNNFVDENGGFEIPGGGAPSENWSILR